MKKYILGLAIIIVSLTSCGTTKVVVPEGTPPEIAHIMTEYNLQYGYAETLVTAFKQQSSLNKYELEDISSVYVRSYGVYKVLSVRVGNSSEIIVNLD